MSKKYCYLLFGVLFLCACGNQQPTTTQTQSNIKYPEYSLALGTSDQKEQSFLPKGLLTTSKEAYFFFDDEREKLVRIDKQQKSIKLFGGKGSGPGEFHQIDLLKYSNGMLFALDGNASQMNVYDGDGEFLEQFYALANQDTRFCVDDQNRVYLSTPYSESPITVLDIGGQRVRGFGEWHHDRLPRLSIKEPRHLMWSGEHLISVSKIYPVFELFNSNGELVRRRQFQDHPLIKERIQADRMFFEIHPEDKDLAAFTLFHDASYSNDRLYVSFSRNPENREPGEIPVAHTSHLFIFDCSDSDIKLLDVVELGVEQATLPYMIKSFSVDANNQMIVYESNRGRLDIFQL